MEKHAQKSPKAFDRILLTGANGEIGQILRRSLPRVCTRLRLADVVPMEQEAEHEEIVQTDLNDQDAAKITQGVDAIVHMAALGSNNAFTDLVHSNIVAAYNMFEAARKSAVPRIVFGSTNHVVGFHETSQVIDETAPPKPDGLYGATKVFGEALGQYYFDRFGIETVSIRIGSCFARPRDRRMLNTWMSHRDMANLVERALCTPDVGHMITYGVSDNPGRYWHSRSWARLCFAPQDSAEVFRAEIEAHRRPIDPNDPRARYHGGSEAGKPIFK